MQGTTTETGTMMTIEVLANIRIGDQKIAGAELAQAVREELSKSHAAFPYQTIYHLVQRVQVAWLGDKGGGKGQNERRGEGRPGGAHGQGHGQGRGRGGGSGGLGVGGASSSWLGGSGLV